VRVPPDVYLKKLSFNGGSLNDSLVHLSPDTNATLRIEVGGDGARLSFQVTDEDDKPVSDAPVIMVPDGELPAALLADRLLAYRTDPDGICTSGALAPGNYRALALTRQLRPIPEDLEKLRSALSQAATAAALPKNQPACQPPPHPPEIGRGRNLSCCPLTRYSGNRNARWQASIGHNAPPWSIPGKVSGAWIFRDTRMPVSIVFEHLEAGATVDEIVEWFHLTREQIVRVLQFAARSLDPFPPPRPATTSAANAHTL